MVKKSQFDKDEKLKWALLARSVLPWPAGTKRNVYPIILTAQKTASISIYIHKVFFLGP